MGEKSQYRVARNNKISNFGDDGLSCCGDFNIIRDNSLTVDDSPRTSKSEDGITIHGIGNQVIGNKVLRTNKDGIEVKFNEDEDDGNNCTQIFTGGFNIICSNKVEAAVNGKGILLPLLLMQTQFAFFKEKTIWRSKMKLLDWVRF